MQRAQHEPEKSASASLPSEGLSISFAEMIIRRSQSSIWAKCLFCSHTSWLKNSRFCPFLGKQKVTGGTNRVVSG